jgi:ribosome-binding ATPase YchF (GTP1/OBG family)
LILRGAQIVGIKRLDNNPRQSVFVFRDFPQRKEFLRQFNFSPEDSPETLVDFRRAVAVIRDLGKPAFEILVKEDLDKIKDLFLLSAKPFIKLLNVSEEDLSKIDKLILESRADMALCAKVEAELSSLSDKDAALYLSELGLIRSGLDKLVRLSYKRLGLISFLTAGVKEVRAWTIKQGMRAVRAAGVIHTDFEKNFIKVKVCDFKDFVRYGGWKGASEQGRVRFEGRDYVIGADDVIEFMIGR